MGDEELVGLVVRDAHVVERRVRARAGIEDEDLIVAQFDHEARTALAATGGIAGTQRGDAHLVGG
jgi:hypothetical protein